MPRRPLFTIASAGSLLLCTALCALNVEVRYPIPVGCLLVLPTAWVWDYCWKRLVLHRRIAAGQCLACGYNLTANISGVCPECGTHVKAA